LRSAGKGCREEKAEQKKRAKDGFPLQGMPGVHTTFIVQESPELKARSLVCEWWIKIEFNLHWSARHTSQKRRPFAKTAQSNQAAALHITSAGQ